MSKFLWMTCFVFIFGVSSAFAVGINKTPSYTSQYIKYRNESTKRIDPRLKHLPGSSKKANKCLQHTMGVCTMTEPENYGRLRYNNAHRKEDPLKKLGFQGAEYWSN